MTFEESPITNVVRYFVALVNVFGNLLIVYIIIRFERCRRSACNCLIGILAFVDSFIGVALLLRTTYSVVARAKDLHEFDRLGCVIIGTFHCFGITAGQILIICMGVDRFTAARLPVRYINWNKERVRRFIVVSSASSVGVGLFFVILPFYGLDAKEPLAVCSISSAAAAHWVYFWSTYNVLCSLAVVVLYAGRVYIRYNSVATTSDARRALQMQKDLLVSILLIVVLYITFHAIPNAILTACWVLDVHSDLVGQVAQIYGIGTGVYSGATVFVYLGKHQATRECFLELTCLRINAVSSFPRY